MLQAFTKLHLVKVNADLNGSDAMPDPPLQQLQSGHAHSTRQQCESEAGAALHKFAHQRHRLCSATRLDTIVLSFKTGHTTIQKCKTGVHVAIYRHLRQQQDKATGRANLL